jgi:hypothetical protein
VKVVDGENDVRRQIVGIPRLVLLLKAVECHPIAFECFTELCYRVMFAVGVDFLLKVLEIFLQVSAKLFDLLVINRLEEREILSGVVVDQIRQPLDVENGGGGVHIDIGQFLIHRLHLMDHGQFVDEDDNAQRHQDKEPRNDLARNLHNAYGSRP